VKPNGRPRAIVLRPRAGRLVATVAVLCLAACQELSEGPPTDVALSAATDTTIRVSWMAPAGAVPDSYVLAFSETGTSEWVEFGVVTDTLTRADHNPLGRTGRYRVTALFKDREYTATEAPTSAPVHAEATPVGELNSSTYSGYGWERDSGVASVFTTKYASNAGRVDFYITDWTTGFAGPDYAMVSPDWGPHEPGGAGLVPAGAWRATWFSSLPSEDQGPLTPFDSTEYANNLTLLPDSTFAAVVCIDTTATADTTDTFVTVSRYYALVKLGRPDIGSGTAPVETWFQLIAGLRLIQH